MTECYRRAGELLRPPPNREQIKALNNVFGANFGFGGDVERGACTVQNSQNVFRTWTFFDRRVFII
jgi:hypothetical protein